MEKNFYSEVMSNNITDVGLYAQFSIDKMPNISGDWLVCIFYKGLKEELEVYEVTGDWINNPYKILSKVEEKDIKFIANDVIEYDDDGNITGEKLCHREIIKWKKDVFAHQYLLRELCTNTNIDITNQEVIYTEKKRFCNSINSTEIPKF